MEKLDGLPYYLCTKNILNRYRMNKQIINYMKKTFLTSLFVACACLSFAAEPYFRATWVSTVANIDFPKKDAIGNYEKQQQDMIAMLDSF